MHFSLTHIHHHKKGQKNGGNMQDGRRHYLQTTHPANSQSVYILIQKYILFTQYRGNVYINYNPLVLILLSSLATYSGSSLMILSPLPGAVHIPPIFSCSSLETSIEYKMQKGHQHLVHHSFSDQRKETQRSVIVFF